mmetsp:Transcript_699/g.1051  ORF Transcript_699/g.1051 Transcript_699/m.1051 type:complete len:97 (-) Transcript_699:1763-2053(-)
MRLSFGPMSLEFQCTGRVTQSHRRRRNPPPPPPHGGTPASIFCLIYTTIQTQDCLLVGIIRKAAQFSKGYVSRGFILSPKEMLLHGALAFDRYLSY